MKRVKFEHKKIIASFLIVIFSQSIILPSAALALTGGPSQPEVESFSPVGMTEMVDQFTGDFKYNIPLLDVGGYPINLSYNAGPTMEQEASWVGLGWNLNPGVINRNLRGLPDDFFGETIETNIYQKPNWTFSIGGSTLVKALGLKVFNPSLGLGIKYNNYTGLGLDLNLHMKLKSFKKEEDNESESNHEPEEPLKLMQFIKKQLGQVKHANYWVSVARNLYPEFNLPFVNGKITRESAISYARGIENPRTFAYKTYTPDMNFDYEHNDLNLSLSLGTDFTGIFGSFPPYATYTSQTLSKKKYRKKAYGYLYHWERLNEETDDVLTEINRERDGTYFKGKPYLPIPISTYDLFSVSGEGVGGQIKPYRNAIDIYSDDEHISTSKGGSSKVELGIGSDLHNEYTFNVVKSESKSGKWNNDLSSFIEEKTLNNNDISFERTYFKFTGENVPFNEELVFNNSSGIISPKVKKEFMMVGSPNLLLINGTNSSLLTGTAPNFYSNKRAIRNQLVSFKTFENIQSFVNPNINSSLLHEQTKFSINGSSPGTVTLPTISSSLSNGAFFGYSLNRKPKHIGEFTITKPDGSIYVYGNAAYNNFQKEVSFTCANKGIISTTNGNRKFGIDKATGKDYLDKLNEGENYKRSDKFYQSTTTPAYAHSYMLSSILSPDYFDILPVGAGPEDLGNYVKFEYGQTAIDYHWRHPYSTDETVFSEGLKSEVYDNKASYTEGKKEIWHLQTIRTKKYVAIFFLEPRLDGIDASGANKSYKLVKISLFERQKYDNTDNPDKTLEPIKSVYFEYDYSLCKGIENTSAVLPDLNGKLTLKSIYFTYGFSTKKFNTYEFKYSTKNPGYSSLNIDRWGNYKSTFPEGINKGEFPYVNQNKLEADENSSAWSITEIKLPSGGLIKINYEADDYAYVQDKLAAQLTSIAGIGSSENYTPGIATYTNANQCNYLYFSIPGNRQGLTPQEYVNQSMQTDGIILFKVFCNIFDIRKEWVHGYGMIDGFGLCPNNTDNQYFYVKLAEKSIESFVEPRRTISPIVKAGLKFTKDMIPHLVEPEWADLITEDQGIQPTDFFVKLLGLGNISEKIRGPYNSMLSRGYANSIVLGKSFARLSNPFKSKIGGGHRIKSLEFNDNWFTLTNHLNNSQKLEQIYSYTTNETIDRLGGSFLRAISSGVASYEPGSGSEENPFKTPIGYNRKISRVFPHEQIEDDGPLGESYFPSPSVGYSKVSIETKGYITNLNGETETETVLVQKKSPAKTVSEFYTGKDFPIKVYYSTIEPAVIEPPFIDLLLFSMSYKRVGVSQGFFIELNDMHGKPKANYEYTTTGNIPNQTDNLLSYTKYFYQTDPLNPQNLNNEVKVILNDKTANIKRVETKTIGVESEFIIDNRMKSDESSSYELQLNTSTLITCFGLTIPAIYPDCGENSDNFYSSVSLTLRNRNGLLYKTEVYQDGAKISNETLAYDGETGEPLVSKTTDEFKENKFSSTIPAHWWYDGMGQSYKNQGIEIGNITTSLDGKIPTFPNISNYFTDGDIVLIVNGTSKVNGFIRKNGSDYTLYSRSEASGSYGVVLPYSGTNLTLKVMRSGRANMQALPVQTFTTLVNPIGSAVLNFDASTKIVDTKVNTYFNTIPNYKTYSEVLSSRDSVYKLNELLGVINYLISTIEYKVTGARASGSKHEDIFQIPNSILSSSNPYTNSAIFKQRVLNGYSKHDFTTYCEYVKGEDLSVFTFEIIFKMGDNTELIFENNEQIEFYGLEDIENCLITGFIYDTQNGPSNYHGRLFYTTQSLDNKILETSNNHCTLLGIFNKKFEFVIDDHLHYAPGNHLRTLPNWHTQTTFAFKGERSYPIGVPMARSGYFKDYLEFDPFVNYINQSTNWKASEVSTLFDPYTGAEIESKDALNRFRTIQYEKIASKTNINGNIEWTPALNPSLYAENARQPQVTCFDFETNNLYEYSNSVKSDKHYFEGGLIDGENKHTGNYGLKVLDLAYYSVPICKGYDLDANVPNSILPFYPEPGKYVFSTWVKTKMDFYKYNSNDPSLGIMIVDLEGNVIGTPAYFTPQGPIINGWQKITGTYEIPNSVSTSDQKYLRVNFKKGSQAVITWFDDFRIFPLNSTVKTFVYNSKMQVTSTLDENNFATFYSYNEKGELISVSKETEKGIVTLKESRKLTKK